MVLDKDDPGFAWNLVQSFLEAQVLLALRSPCLIPINSLTWKDTPSSLTMFLVMEFGESAAAARFKAHTRRAIGRSWSRRLLTAGRVALVWCAARSKGW